MDYYFDNLKKTAALVASLTVLSRDADNKLIRPGFRLDMNNRSIVLAMTQGVGAHLTNDEKRTHLTDLKREHLIDQVCVPEILPPEGEQNTA